VLDLLRVSESLVPEVVNLKPGKTVCIGQDLGLMKNKEASNPCLSCEDINNIIIATHCMNKKPKLSAVVIAYIPL